MMKIVIKNKRGFAACQAAVSLDETRSYLTGVLIEPDGTVVATNSHYMVICKDCVEPFDGDKMIVAAKQLSSAQYGSGFDAELVIEENEGHITAWVGKFKVRKNNKRQLIVADVVDGTFPEWTQFDKEFEDGRDGCLSVAFNAAYLAKVAKVAGMDGETVNVVFNGSLNPANVFFGGKAESEKSGIKMILMPVR